MIKKFSVILLSFVFLIAFFLRLQFLSKLSLKDSQMIRVTGTLSEEPQVSTNRQSFKLGGVEVWTERYPEYHYGNKLEIIGKVKVIPARTFFVGTNRYLLSYPKVSLQGEALRPQSLALKTTAIALRQKLRDIYNHSLPKPLDGIMAGIALGDKSLIPADFWEKLRQTGTLHIMVASGMNIALVSGSTLSLLTLFFRRKAAIAFLLGLIWFYTTLIGFTAPIVRAAIMASLTFLAQFLGKEAKGGRILWLTGFFMLFLNPFLLWDVGFQLSFLATAGLVYLQPCLQSSKNFFLKNENFASSLAAQIMTLPVLLVNFGQLNLASPLINLAVLWVIPFLFQAGMAVGLLGILWLKLGEIFSLLLYPLLWWIWQTVNLSADISMFQIKLPEWSCWVWGIYYLVIIILIKPNKKQNDET